MKLKLIYFNTNHNYGGFIGKANDTIIYGASKEDISKLTVAELKKIAKDKNVNGYSTMKKAELIDALK